MEMLKGSHVHTVLMVCIWKGLKYTKAVCPTFPRDWALHTGLRREGGMEVCPDESRRHRVLRTKVLSSTGFSLRGQETGDGAGAGAPGGQP